MRIGGALITIASGCGFHPSATAPDARDAPPSDIDIDAPIVPCHDRWLDGSIRFGAPVRLDTLSVTSFSDRDPYVTPDGLTIYFSSNRADPVYGTSDTYVATRTSALAAFTTPMTFAATTTAADDGKVSMTDDGLHLVASNNTMVDADLYEAERATPDDAFSLLSTTHFGATIDNADAQEDPWISNDGTRIFFALHTNVQHIALTTRTAIDQDFQPAMIVASLDSNVGDADPALSSDERIIVFSSNRSLPGFAGTNIWYATRAGASGDFDPPQPVPDLNTPMNDGDLVLGADGCAVYFASDRAGDYDLYVATAM